MFLFFTAPPLYEVYVEKKTHRTQIASKQTTLTSCSAIVLLVQLRAVPKTSAKTKEKVFLSLSEYDIKSSAFFILSRTVISVRWFPLVYKTRSCKTRQGRRQYVKMAPN